MHLAVICQLIPIAMQARQEQQVANVLSAKPIYFMAMHVCLTSLLIMRKLLRTVENIRLRATVSVLPRVMEDRLTVYSVGSSVTSCTSRLSAVANRAKSIGLEVWNGKPTYF